MNQISLFTYAKETYYTIIMKTSGFGCMLVQCVTLNSITHHLRDHNIVLSSLSQPHNGPLK